MIKSKHNASNIRIQEIDLSDEDIDFKKTIRPKSNRNSAKVAEITKDDYIGALTKSDIESRIDSLEVSLEFVDEDKISDIKSKIEALKISLEFID
jgi:hypothetical protein